MEAQPPDQVILITAINSQLNTKKKDNVKALETAQAQADFGEKSEFGASGQHIASFCSSVALP